jgi:phage shock protein C
MHIKRLHKSKHDRVLGGVIGGLGEYFSVDSTLIRLFWVLVVIFTGFFPGVVAYLIALMVVPREARVG